MIQQERRAQVTVPVVMRTHECEERNLKLALAEIRRRKIVKAEPVFIRIEERLKSRWPTQIKPNLPG